MSEPNFVLSELEFVVERQSKKGVDSFTMTVVLLQEAVFVDLRRFVSSFTPISRDVILKVLHIFTATLPSFLEYSRV
jgi:hypothetical protein